MDFIDPMRNYIRYIYIFPLEEEEHYRIHESI